MSSDYSAGLRHGREDLGKVLAEILDSDASDERKIEQLRLVLLTIGVVEPPDAYPDEDAHDPRD